MTVAGVDGWVGPKQPVSAANAVCASQDSIVTDTLLEVMRNGGSAVDAAIAGCLVQPVVQPDMTNHTGTITLLYREATTGRTCDLVSWGTIVPDLPPLRPIPRGKGFYTAVERDAVRDHLRLHAWPEGDARALRDQPVGRAVRARSCLGRGGLRGWLRYDYHMGSFQMSSRDKDGTLHATAGPRRAGSAAGF